MITHRPYRSDAPVRPVPIKCKHLQLPYFLVSAKSTHFLRGDIKQNSKNTNVSLIFDPFSDLIPISKDVIGSFQAFLNKTDDIFIILVLLSTYVWLSDVFWVELLFSFKFKRTFGRQLWISTIFKTTISGYQSIEFRFNTVPWGVYLHYGSIVGFSNLGVLWHYNNYVRHRRWQMNEQMCFWNFLILPRSRGPLQFSCSRSRNVLIIYMWYLQLDIYNFLITLRDNKYERVYR